MTTFICCIIQPFDLHIVLLDFLQFAVESQEKEMQDGEDYAALNADFNFTALAAYNEFPYICRYKGMLLQFFTS